VPTLAVLDRGIDAQRIADDLKLLRPLTKEVRTYTVDRGLDQVPRIAGTLGLKVTLGLYLGRDPEKNAVELTRGIGAVKANRKVISRVIVGNESIQHGHRTVDEVIAAMDEVRRGVGTSMPVGTSEIWSVWLREPRLAAASAFIAVHILPYWDGVPVTEAAGYVHQRVEELRAAYPGKPIIISETGWPSSGPMNQAALPSPENQAKFVAAFTSGGTARAHMYMLVEAFDQPWKATSEGDLPLWGLYDLNRGPKLAARALQPRW
jgi:exo-beta-1,3-glucanase (GH17 family)